VQIRIINLNTTAGFTEADRRSGAAVAAVGTTVVAVNPRAGAPSIECHVDEAVATLGVVEAVRAGEAEGADGYVIACFGDTGIAAARELASGPVVGMTEAALFAAALVADTFSIVTLPARTRIHARRVVRSLGLDAAGRCLSIRAIDVPVLYGEDEEQAVAAAILGQGRDAISEDGAEAIILGCAGIGHLVPHLEAALSVPVIDGVAVAVTMAEGLVRCGLRTSKRSSYALPPAKARTGAFAAMTGA
jgi:allantoin racemase